jgi:hypothetical protein
MSMQNLLIGKIRRSFDGKLPIWVSAKTLHEASAALASDPQHR